MDSHEATRRAGRFEIFRSAGAPDLRRSGIEKPVPRSPEVLERIAVAVEAGYANGTRSKVLYAAPGFSLVYAWFKRGFPLPRHSHDADCLYFVLSGSLRFGREEIHAGDGFFIGSGVPYAYTAGEQGVEILEFRTVESFDNQLHATSLAFWSKVAASVRDRQPDWLAECASPSGMIVD